MEYINEININEAIIHVLDKSQENPVYNDFTLKLTDETYEYLLRHIKRVLKNDNLKYGIFNSDENSVKDHLTSYFEKEFNFNTLSKKLANDLFNIIKNDDTIPSGDILVISISTDYGPMIGILKMDYVKSYAHAIDFVDGRNEISIISKPGDLPNRQTVEKAAFVKPLFKDNNFDLMFFDKSFRKNTKKETEDYFKTNFLKCSLIENERDQTKKLLLVSETFTRTNLKENASAAEYFRSNIQKKLIDGEKVNIDDVSSELEGVFPDEIREEFSNYLKDFGVPDVVCVDKKYVDKKLSNKKLSIDKDIVLLISSEAYFDKSRFQIVENEDGTINMLIKNVKSYTEK